MIEVAIYAADAATRERLAALAGRAELHLAGSVDSPLALARFLDQAPVDVVLTEAPAAEDLTTWLGDHRAPFVVLVEEGDLGRASAALHAGAAGVLPRGADPDAIALGITAACHALSVMPAAFMAALLRGVEPSMRTAAGDEAPGAEALTTRELEVLAAMADGASNKTIARRLGISFHTVKFHVASILEKLDADSRTEAVAAAARRGLVML
jgi:DNA-binding NarL/FixJ family response regulator